MISVGGHSKEITLIITPDINYSVLSVCSYCLQYSSPQVPQCSSYCIACHLTHFVIKIDGSQLACIQLNVLSTALPFIHKGTQWSQLVVATIASSSVEKSINLLLLHQLEILENSRSKYYLHLFFKKVVTYKTHMKLNSDYGNKMTEVAWPINFLIYKLVTLLTGNHTLNILFLK